MSPNAIASSVIQQFQSEADAINEAPQPKWARITIFVLTGLFLSVVAIMCLTKMDRVVSSVGGKMVSIDLTIVFQALDPSIIKSIDVREGDEVAKGQQLAALDPTFATADVKQLRQQVADLRAQIERDEAQLNKRPFVSPQQADSEALRSAAEQKQYYDQQVAQYKAQLNSFDAKINQTQATIQKYEADGTRYQQREQIAQQIEDMRATLAAHGTGSQYNLLISQDQRVDMLRTLEYDHNSLVESQHTLASICLLYTSRCV